MATRQRPLEGQARREPASQSLSDAGPMDVKSEVARTLIAAMREGNTPWQKPWSAAAMLPTNCATGNGYRGVNRLLLSIAAMESASGGDGRVDNRFLTYNQAAAKGWQVRKGSRGTPIVKLVELGDGRDADDSGNPTGAASKGGDKASAPRFALRRYTVFNASQVDGAPPLEDEAAPAFEPVDRAEAIMEALKQQTGLRIVYGGDTACYAPSTDQVFLPNKSAFKATPGVQAAYGFYSVALHECSHSSLAEHRLDRREALSKRWGDEAYALEELTVEIASACLAAETGVPIIHARPQAHIDHHARYLNSWLTAIASDPMAIFTAAKSAESIVAYLLGLERQHAQLADRGEWLADYERAESARQPERHR